MLTFNLKKEWFEKIMSGEKTHEYRKANNYWENRISNALEEHNAKHNNRAVAYFRTWADVHGTMKVKFCLGYPKTDDKERTLLAKVKKIRVIDGTNTDLKHNGDVFDIEFELIKKQKSGSRN